MPTKPFESWLELTRELQTRSFGTDPHELEGVERAEFVSWNTTALVAELGEMLAEFPGWKPWVTDRSVLNREAFIGEMVDALHFVANILSAVRCTDDELNAAYMRKVRKNEERMASGTYDGVSEKCPECKRELVHDAGPPPGWWCSKHGRIRVGV